MKGVNPWLAVLVALVAGLLAGGRFDLADGNSGQAESSPLGWTHGGTEPEDGGEGLEGDRPDRRRRQADHDYGDSQHGDAITHGNRLIMMNDGKVVLDIKGEEKKKLTVEKLLHQFEVVSGEEFASDKAILG